MPALLPDQVRRRKKQEKRKHVAAPFSGGGRDECEARRCFLIH
jgi:hypothetical protein